MICVLASLCRHTVHGICLRSELGFPTFLTLYTDICKFIRQVAPRNVDFASTLKLHWLATLLYTTFDLSTFKWVTGHCMSRASFLTIFSFLRPSVLDLASGTGQTDRQTDRRRAPIHSAPLYGAGIKIKYKLLCPRGTQTCALAVANIAHAVYLLDVAKRPIPQG